MRTIANQGLISVDLSWKDANGIPIQVQTTKLEVGTDEHLAIELAHYIQSATEKDLTMFWYMLRRRRRAINNGRDVTLQRAGLMECLDDENYQCADAERLLLEGFDRLTNFAKQVAADSDGCLGAGSMLRKVIDLIPEEFVAEDESGDSLRHMLPSLDSQ